MPQPRPALPALKPPIVISEDARRMILDLQVAGIIATSACDIDPVSNDCRDKKDNERWYADKLSRYIGDLEAVVKAGRDLVQHLDVPRRDFNETLELIGALRDALPPEPEKDPL